MARRLAFKLGEINLLLTFLTLAIIITICSVPLYRGVITWLHLPEQLQVPFNEIMRDYWAILKYLHSPWQKVLEVRNFSLSSQGRFHFYEVRRLFLELYGVGGLSSIGTYFFWQHLKKRNQLWILEGFFAKSLWAPLGIGIILTISFEPIFIGFHHVLFNNDAWLFDPLTDSIILMLPEVYFMACFLWAMGLMELFLFWAWRLVKKKVK
ncbi:TIGR01906 family membrane protein [Aerococcus christensenii]|uniref:TIGR01906 family protein n=1 Tax=Aerococcus christensenii TaxID=87541 RepID=A0A133XZS6_9LACT|nr:TIGR01906 family membrane protein [Aerococcus christensenii]KXB36431.1 TIGR01906 family protein [Aerococcus christensenii]MDK8234268.1 TIGR01906 family membrane protein [Aerococcus christensenii]